MSDPSELALVHMAISSGVTGCYEWDDKEAERVRNDPGLQGLTPEYIRQQLHEFVVKSGADSIRQIRESRSVYSHRTYYYKVIIPEPEFKFGLFVEVELTDDDPDLPCMTILNAHPQLK